MSLKQYKDLSGRVQDASLLLYYIPEEFSFLLSELCLSLHVWTLIVSHPARDSSALHVIPLPDTYQRMWGFYTTFHASDSSLSVPLKD